MNRSAPVAAVALDALRGAWARPLATGVCALVVAAVCVVTLLTTGRTAATEAQVIASIDAVGTRLVTVTDATGSAGIDPSAPDLVATLEGVAWAFGVGPALATTNPAIGTVVGGSTSARALVGTLPPDASLTAGRAPVRPGEAIVGELARPVLGLSDVAGALSAEGRTLAAVGQFAATGPLEGLGASVLYVPLADEAPPVRYLYVLAEEGTDVVALAAAVEAIVPAHQPAAVEVDVPSGAIELRDVVSGTLGAASRNLMAVVLGTGLLLVAVTMTGAVAARRRDFGRQRALGATRLDVVVAVLVHSGLAGALGTAVGLGVGLAATWATTGALPHARFTAGLAGLTLYVTLLGSLPPAVAAALRDPVRILRVA